MGFTDWRSNYEWKIKNAIDRASGSRAGTEQRRELPNRRARTEGSPFYNNWQECWGRQRRPGRRGQRYRRPNVLPPGDMAYPMQTLACRPLPSAWVSPVPPRRMSGCAEVLRLSTPSSYVYARWSIADSRVDQQRVPATHSRRKHMPQPFLALITPLGHRVRSTLDTTLPA
jgi:hypothetical protein